MADVDSRSADETEQFMDGTFIRRAVRGQVILLACVAGLTVAASRVTGLRRQMLVACALTLGAGTAWSAYLTLGLEQVRRVIRQSTAPDRLVR
jgi:threonine/homoserine efflux transporter RhtA